MPAIPPMAFRSARWAAAIAIGAFGLAFSQPAAAIPDSTLVIPFSNGVATGGGPTDVIGNNFDTTLITATRSGNASSVTLTLVYHTQYDNASTAARYADVFFRFPSGPAGSFTYGAALGYQASIGGVANNLLSGAGFAYKTSNEVWGGSSATYGGQFVDLDNTNEYSPVRVTGGTDVGNVSVVRTGPVSGFYDLTVTITSNDANFITATGNANPFDVFWGTGDCSNDAILVTLAFPNQLIETPEPASLAVLGIGLLGLGMTVRRRRA